jgi:hypothetical protein
MVRNGTLTIDDEVRLLNNHFFEKILFFISKTDVPAAWGYLALIISVVAFGSNSLPIKKFDIRDGFAYQLNVCCSIFTVGVIANCLRYFPRFYFLPMVGGFCWFTASLMTIPSIKIIGMFDKLVHLAVITQQFFVC